MILTQPKPVAEATEGIKSYWDAWAKSHVAQEPLAKIRAALGR